MRYYIDSSIAVQALLPAPDGRARAWLVAHRNRPMHLLSSSLLQLELVRTLRRDKLSPSRANLILQSVELAEIDRDILAAAAAIEPHVKSLDAIHLATCLRLGSPTLVTHDRGMLAAAAGLGIETHDPLAA